MKILLVVVAVMFILCAAAYAEEKPKIGQDDFISSTVSDVFDKLNQYTSGQAKILDENWKRSDEGQARGKDMFDDDMRGVTIRSNTPSSAQK